MGNSGHVGVEEVGMPELMVAHDVDFERITVLFREFCEQHALSVMTFGGDMHGVYVWRAGARVTLNRYLTVAVTPVLEDELQTNGYAIMIGADNGERFVSRTLFEWAGTLDDIPRLPGDNAEQELLLNLAKAWNAAGKIKEMELTERY